MEDKVRILGQISDYDELVGAETLHPLVNVVDFSKLPPLRNLDFRRMFGYYAIYLKGPKIADLRYGMSTYGYDDGTLVFFAPGQVVGTEDDGIYHQMKTRVLMFHPDLLNNSYLAGIMNQYTYFSYDTNESLVPTVKEKNLIISYFNQIEDELRHFDSSSLTIVIDYIKLVFDSCERFYKRQFADNHIGNLDLLAQLENIINEYFNSKKPFTEGVLTVAYCAAELNLSSNYLTDLVRQATGMSVLKLIHLKMLDLARTKLSCSSKRVNDVAEELGFQQPQNFSNWFKKMEGCSPLQYRSRCGIV